MKRLVIGAVLAVSALVSTSAMADKLTCTRVDGTQHTIYSNSSAVQVGSTVFKFLKTGTLDNGTEVYMFNAQKQGKMMAMAMSNDGIVYQIRDAKMQIIEEGLCK